ncbi:MAG: hypothetical protein MI919_31070, partial [Holophagales bacterium]|nr:hypothetical protein [Holophagales bacterium]
RYSMWIHRSPYLLCWVASLALIPGLARAQGLVTPVGSPSGGNEYTTGDQSSPAVAGLEDRFAVVWKGPDGADSLGPGIFLRFVSAATGAPLGQDVRISEAGASDVGPLDLAAAPNGQLVAVWVEERDGMESLNAVLFTPELPIGTPITLAGPMLSVRSPVVAMDAAGRFAAMWVDGIFPGALLRGSLFTSSGELIMPFFETTFGGVADPSNWDLGFYPDGRIGVAISRVVAQEVFVIELALFDSAGNPADPPTRLVRESVSALLSNGRLIVEAGGSYWVLYAGSLGAAIYSSRFDSTGALEGHLEYERPPSAYGVEGAASLTTDSVVISTELEDNGPIGYSQLGTVGVHTHGTVTSAGERARIARLATEDIWLVAWQELDGDGNGLGILSQRLEIPPFSDGFESGNVTAWSSSVGGGP